MSLDYDAFSNILSSKYLNVTNEYIVWKAIHDWINFDKNSRLEHLPDLIYNCLRFGRLEKHFIEIFIFECDLFIALPDAVQCGLKDFINNDLKTCQQKAADSFNLSKSSYGCHFLPRIASQKLLVCIGKFKPGSIHYYDQKHNNWHSLPISLHLPNGQYNYQLALLDNMMFAFGGIDDDNRATNKMWSRDLSDPSSQWTARANMKQSRKQFCSVVLNDTIYALGGRGNNNEYSLRSCERYCSQLNEWSTVADMNSERVYASAAVINGCIYVAGGWNEELRAIRSVSKYCPETDTWREVAWMTTGRYFFTLTPFAGRLWAIGGLVGYGHRLSSCESYDPVTETWREEAPLKEGRRDHAAIEFNEELYVVGGWRKNDEGWSKSPTLKTNT